MVQPHTAFGLDSGPESLPKHVVELRSHDGAVSAGVSPYGGQLWSARIAGRDVILPLTKPHSTGRDTRPNPNSDQVGETTAPGGTWLSFGESRIQESDGEIREMPVHGPMSAPWNRHSVVHKSSDIIVMNSAGVESSWFRRGEGYKVEREVQVDEGDGGAEGAIVITNTIISTGSGKFVAPEAVEHTYFVSGEGAALLNSSGQLTPIEEVDARSRFEPSDNGNAIDSRFDSTLTGMLGRCVFLPNGRKGHAVVIDALTIHPDGSTRPVETFCAYRFRSGDPWTAIEPISGGISMHRGQYFSLITGIRTFASLEAYQSSLDAERHSA